MLEVTRHLLQDLKNLNFGLLQWEQSNDPHLSQKIGVFVGFFSGLVQLLSL